MLIDLEEQWPSTTAAIEQTEKKLEKKKCSEDKNCMRRVLRSKLCVRLYQKLLIDLR